MSNYPDNMDWKAYDAAYGEPSERTYPTWDEIHAIARKHLEPAFRAMATEIATGWADTSEFPFPEADLKNLIDWTISDGVTEAMDSKYADAVNAGE